MRALVLFRRMLPVLLPGALAAAALWVGVPRINIAAIRAQVLLAHLPFILLGTGALIGLLFHQSRISALTVLCAGVTYAAGWRTPGGPEATLGIILLPLAAIVTAWQSDLRSFSSMAVMRLLLGSVLCGFVLMANAPLLSGPLTALTGATVGPARINIAQAASLLLTMTAAVSLVLSRRRRTNAIVLQGLIASLLSVEASARGAGAPWYGLTLSSAALLLWAILDGAWQHAFLDELTGLPGRRPMEHHLASLGRRYALALVDIDRFKRINDRHGHDVGDQVLRFVASQLRAFRHGTVYRYGGEEFVIVMRAGDKDLQTERLQELRKRIAGRGFVLRSLNRPKRKPKRPRKRTAKGSGTIRVTVSIGLALRQTKHRIPSDVLQTADKALYRAKRGGRNRVCVA